MYIGKLINYTTHDTAKVMPPWPTFEPRVVTQKARDRYDVPSLDMSTRAFSCFMAVPIFFGKFKASNDDISAPRERGRV